MKKPLFIGIAVHKPKFMDMLPGVLDALDQMASWASTKYDVVAFDDRASPVTIDRIRSLLTPNNDSGESNPDLLLERPRIIVYFCGHGIADWPDQYWILSPGPEQTRQRISANAFRDTLASYGPKQIAFISDACRSPGHTLGAGDAVLDFLDGPYKNPQKDIFYSCEDGENSFAVPATTSDPAYLIFSSALHRALSKPDGSNLDLILLKLNKQAVTSQSLATYLEEHVPTSALKVRKIQRTQCDPGFRPVDHIYEHVYEEFPAPNTIYKTKELSSDPKPEVIDVRHDNLAEITEFISKPFKVTETTHRQRLQAGRFELSQSEWRAPLIKDIHLKLSGFTKDPAVAIVGVRDPEIVDIRGHHTNLPKWTEYIGDKKANIFSLGNSESFEFNKTTLIRYGDRSLNIIPNFPYMYSICVGSENKDGAQGLDFISWISVHGDYEDEKLIYSAEALNILSRGLFRSIDAVKISGQMRYAKHLDPMIGIVAAYLYNNSGDIDNIRRMAYYYVCCGQSIPFDLALLANLPFYANNGGFFTDVPPVNEASTPDNDAPDFTREATHAVSGPIAGLAPVLRVGWPYLRNSPHRLHQVCWEFIDHLAPSPITTFTGEPAISAISAAFERNTQ